MTNKLESFFSRNQQVVRVVIDALKGSSPREVGARIFVSADAQWGTIGGGQLEFLAIDEARRMIRQGADVAHLDVPLGPEIGQCCGGRVALAFTRLDEQSRNEERLKQADADDLQTEIYIFGAGHVGRALASALSLLPVKPILVDSRASELALSDADVEHRLSALPESDVRKALPNSAFVILTHDHALDFLLAREALLRGDALYVGMIGSKTKRATFANWLQRQLDKEADLLLEDLVCPIGAGGSYDKRPAVIAAMVAAELMIWQDMRATLGIPDQENYGANPIT